MKDQGNMASEIIVPSPGESITQVQVAKWLVSDGEEVDKDQEVVEIDSDKASFPLTAPENGILKIIIAEGETVGVGATIARIEPSAGGKKPSHEKTAVAPVTKIPVIIKDKKPSENSKTGTHISPLAEKMRSEKNIQKEEVFAAFEGRRIVKKDIENYLISSPRTPNPSSHYPVQGMLNGENYRTLRLKLAERLVAVKNETAMLTTFNEVNMRKYS
jgi:2-oxoglutarate dehydrogenase E2 component (dihydrolipoamide succinyltransferase)